MSSFSRMQISLFSRPSLTCSGLNILISCMDTFATRFARRCSSCSSGVNWLMSNSVSDTWLTSVTWSSVSTWGSGTGWLRGGGAGAAAFGSGWLGAGRAGAGDAGGSGATRPMASLIFSSRGLLGPGWRAMAVKRVRTSRAAVSDAAAVWARSMGGSALVGLLLEQAATISLMDC